MGKYRDRVKNGDIKIMLKCSMIVFSLNTLGIIQNTVLSALLIPLVFQLGFVAFTQGISFAKTKGSSFFSILGYYTIGGLEWITYPLTNFAGVLFTVSVINSLIAHTRIDMLGRLGEVVLILIPCTIILFVQSILELLYIKKVLRMGGTGVPLEPY